MTIDEIRQITNEHHIYTWTKLGRVYADDRESLDGTYQDVTGFTRDQLIEWCSTRREYHPCIFGR